MEGKTAIVAGATGLVGGHCLRLLLDDPRYGSVVALSRRPLDLQHPKLLVRLVDFDRLDAMEPFPIDDVFCALGTTIRKAGSREQFRRVDFEYPLALARLSSTMGARDFVLVSSVGAAASAGNFYLRVKGELEQAVERLRLTSLHVFQPSVLLGSRAEVRRGERLAQWLMTTFRFALAGPLRKYRPIHGRTVAAAMVSAANSGSAGLLVYRYQDILRLSAGVRHKTREFGGS